MNGMRLLAGVAAVSGLLIGQVGQALALETRTEKISIAVSATPLVTTSEKYPVNSVAWPCPLQRNGTAPDPSSPGFDRVGWTHIYDDGTAPFPCKYRLNHVQRIAVNMNLAPIEKDRPSAFVDSALLSFDKKRVSGDHECADHFMTIVGASAPIPPAIEEHWDLPVPRLGTADCVGSRCSVQIKGQLNEWLQGRAANMGLALIGDQERLDANDNVSCVTEYGNFRLDVVYRHDVPARSVSTPILQISPGAIALLKPDLKVTLVRKAATEAVYDLTWTAGTGTVDIVRDGAVILKGTLNDGNQRDRAPFGTVRYKICKPSGICSNEVTVTS